MVGNQICGRSGEKIASQDGSGREISSGPCPDTPVFEFTHRGHRFKSCTAHHQDAKTQNTQCSLAMDGFAGVAASKFRRCDKIHQCQAILRNDIAGFQKGAPTRKRASRRAGNTLLGSRGLADPRKAVPRGIAFALANRWKIASPAFVSTDDFRKAPAGIPGQTGKKGKTTGPW
jgi:hypothetical protein